MSRIAIALLPAALFLASALPLAADDLKANIDAILAEAFPADGPGAAVAVVKDGRIVYEGASGLADVEREVAMTPDRVFDLASCSKSVTALAVLLLRKEGKLALDDPATKWLPELAHVDPTRPIRVIDLVHMVSGLPDYMDLVDAWEGVDGPRIAKLVGARPLAFPTGSRYEYSNTDYCLLSTVVARASGRPFGEYVREAILRPAGMTSSMVFERPGQEIPRRVHGYRWDEDEEEWMADVDDTPGIVGDGMLFSSAGDLARYAIALEAGTLLSPEDLALSIASGRLDSGEPTGYAFGWIEWGDGRRAVTHDGAWAGTTTRIARLLDERTTIVVLANAADADVDGPAEAIAELLDD